MCHTWVAHVSDVLAVVSSELMRGMVLLFLFGENMLAFVSRLVGACIECLIGGSSSQAIYKHHASYIDVYLQRKASNRVGIHS